jgi:hypothetical protein
MTIYSAAMAHYIRMRRQNGYSTRQAFVSTLMWYSADVSEFRGRVNRGAPGMSHLDIPTTKAYSD